MAHIKKQTFTSAKTGRTVTRWQARYRGPEGKERSRRFPRKVDAEAWLTANGADLARGSWIDPKAGRITLRRFSGQWLAQRGDLRRTTRAKYEGLLDRHIHPALGDTTMANLSASTVRAWHSGLQGRHPSTAANAYRLLGAICRTAVDDGVIGQSPCRVKGAASENATERPTISVAELDRAVASAPDKWRLGILLAAWCQLRRGEVLGLQRKDVDQLHGTLTIRRAVTVDSGTGHAVIDKPKTEAAARTMTMPPNVVDALANHLEDHAGPLWPFPGVGDTPAHPRTLSRIWAQAREVAGRPDVVIHDLRHSGATWLAISGATTAELQHRVGHASPIAAARYQHATKDRDRALAEALGKLASGVSPIPAESSRNLGSRRAKAEASK